MPSAARRLALIASVLGLLLFPAVVPLSSHAQVGPTLPSGFQETVVFSGLTNPTVVRFAPDGRVFVGEKSGLIKVFASLSATTPTVFADLRTNVHNFWDRGLLGLALDPAFPTSPYVYVLYTHDAAIGGVAPRWGSVGGTSDGCANPPGATGDGCVVSGRLSRLQASGNVMIGAEQVLIEDWCQQYPSHSIGSLVFGQDGALYVSGGDGASFNFVDYGQDGSPLNPCGDPPGGVGATLTSPSAEGGSLRSQDLRTIGDPLGLDGTILRVDAATGNGLPDNPLAGHTDPNARRVIAYGLRNPFRMTVRPGTNELWIGDVGWAEWEEINRIVNPTDGTVKNFGWPCYEGQNRQNGYDGADLAICENLYAAGPSAVVGPYFAYHHNNRVVPNESCPTGSSAIAGLAFAWYQGGAYPAEYDGTLFFADNSRDCIWAMKKGVDSLPAPGLLQTFVAGAANPVDLQIGPGGDLYYVDFDGGTIRRIRYTPGNQSPTATAQASPTSGIAPLTVQFDGTGSSDPEGDALVYAWDLDGDGAFDDAGTPLASFTYTAAGVYTARLQVTDTLGASTTSLPLTITANNTPPVASMTAPASGTSWKVGDTIAFAGGATDAQDGTLAPAALSWELILHHCPTNCHIHALQTFDGVASGSFVAPDHEYPSHLELRHTATDSGGLTHTVSRLLEPQTTTLAFQSSPAGLQVVVGASGTATPFSRTVILGSSNSISAPSPQTLGGTTYQFAAWSDGGAQTHNIVAGGPTTYTATFVLAPTVHVGDLDGSATRVNKNQWRASVTVRADDAAHAAVSGATVSGTWSGGASGSATCVTAADGTCRITTGNISTRSASATFTVASISHPSRTYAPGANHDPDGDSNGTAISVARP